MNESETPFLKAEQLARRWKINHKTVLNGIERGEIPCVKIGRKWLIPLAWVESKELEPAAL